MDIKIIQVYYYTIYHESSHPSQQTISVCIIWKKCFKRPNIHQNSQQYHSSFSHNESHEFETHHLRFITITTKSTSYFQEDEVDCMNRQLLLKSPFSQPPPSLLNYWCTLPAQTNVDPPFSFPQYLRPLTFLQIFTFQTLCYTLTRPTCCHPYICKEDTKSTRPWEYYCCRYISTTLGGNEPCFIHL